MSKIYIEVSAGELFDKISILEIKKLKIKDKEKLIIIETELKSLKKTLKENKFLNIAYYHINLRSIYRLTTIRKK